MGEKYRIFVADKLHKKGVELLEAQSDFEVVVKPGLGEDELCEAIKGMHAVIVRSGVKITGKVIEAADVLRVIGRAGIGVDNIDVAKATERGILVMNNPSGNAVTTAEHAIALMFALARRIPQAHASVTSGKWERSKFQGTELSGKILGIVGLGNIGSIVAEKAVGLGLTVIAHDPYASEEAARRLGVKLVSFDELLEQADIITLHVPLTENTKGLIGSKALSKMKERALLINCARGGVVDEEALVEALKGGRIAGAAIDVYSQEPPSPDHPLFSLENVVCTPHLGASTREAQENVAIGIVQQITDFLRKGIIRHAVNMPSISPEAFEAIRPYTFLIEKLGRFVALMKEEGITAVSVKYAGDVAKHDCTPLNFYLMKGILQPALGEKVSLVNAQQLFRERSIRFTESKTEAHEDFTNLIEVKVKRDSHEDVVWGVIFGRNIPKIVRINDFYLEADPEGHVIMLENYDRPGVIGNLGTYLGEKNINIAHMKIGRDKPGGRAISIIHVDSEVGEEILEGLKKLPHIISARYMKL